MNCDKTMTGATPEAIEQVLVAVGLLVETVFDGETVIEPVPGFAMTPAFPVWQTMPDAEGQGGVIGGYVAGLRFTGAPVPILDGLREPEDGDPGFGGPVPEAADKVSQAGMIGDLKARVIEEAESYGLRLRAGYPESEVLSWAEKATQARAIAADPDAPAVMVRTEAGFLGIDPVDLARRISAKAGRYEKAVALISALRQKTLAGIDEAPDYEAALAVAGAARDQADQLFAGL